MINDKIVQENFLVMIDGDDIRLYDIYQNEFVKILVYLWYFRSLFFTEIKLMSIFIYHCN